VDELKRPSSAAAAAAHCALIAARWDGSAGASVLLGSSNLAVPAIVRLGREPDASPLSNLLMLFAEKQLVKVQEDGWHGSIYLSRQEDVIECENGSMNRHQDHPCDQYLPADENAMLMCISCGSCHEGKSHVVTGLLSNRPQWCL